MFQRRRRAALMVALGLAGCAHGSGRGQDGALRWRYRVEVPAALDRLRVEVCFPDKAPRRLKIDEDDAAAVAAVTEVSADKGSARLDREAATIVLGPLPAGACVRYSVATEALLEGSGSRLSARAGEVVSVDPRLVLWRPATLYFEADVALELALADGVTASVPWPATGENKFHLPVTALMWASQAVFGGLTTQTVEAAGATFSVAIVDQPRKLSAAGVEKWIATAAETVATLYGKFPVERMQVVVLPFPGGGGPVYFGMALRGGGPSVQLLVSSEAADHAFPGEWVAIHEFLHHGMPFVQQADAWLSEGFVTYYTEILPTRRGFRSESAGWQALLDGFGRGRKGGTGQPLAQESREMHETHSYQRVYWSGAALALLANVGLRGGDGERSLDAAMRHLLRCCAHTPRVWTAEAALRELDAWAGSPVFTELATSWLPRAEFPELDAVYRRLGLDVINGEVKIRQSAPAAAVRRAIFARPPGPSAGP
ncbi:hypothetical protein [Nannocystis pusilla]|uniref:hypothetical protein n=1 Tax=Nannocystis pusilla TaxID=889268 RepID=UPI003DA4FB76